MPSAALAHLETLLRTRKLDGTITRPFEDRYQPIETVAPVGIRPIDDLLRGGLPRGQLSEIVGARSAGRTTVLHALLAAATARGELVALVDTLDAFDPPSAAEAGVVLERMLWVRGPSITQTPVCRPHADLFQTACERAIKAFNLVLQAGGCGSSALPVLAVLDLAEMPALALRRIPFITWLRLQRVLEGSEGVGVLLADTSLGRSARGVTLQLTSAPAHAEARSPHASSWAMPAFQLSAQLSAASAGRAAEKQSADS